MQLNSIVATTLAIMTGLTVAMPTSAGPYRTEKITIPSNSTVAQPSGSATPSRTVASGTPSSSSSLRAWPKVMASNVANRTQDASQERKQGHEDPNMCPELCALQAQSCTVALPADETFCWRTYVECSRRCGPQEMTSHVH